MSQAGTMEQVHGVDVSWMTQGSPREKFIKNSPPTRTPAPAQPRQVPGVSSSPASADTNGHTKANGHQPEATATTNGTSTPRRLSRSGSIERQNGPNGTPLQRRGSWFSNISAKLSGSSSSPPSHVPAPHQPQPQHQQQPPENPQPTQAPGGPQHDPLAPKISPAKSAVLPHGAKPEGNAPYTPAPPRSGQAGFLGVFRRLSSSGGALGAGGKLGNGLVERRILNVDPNRQRCPINELKGAKLRRVAFCVDVEIAPMPKYSDGEAKAKAIDTAQKKKMTEKGEGEALKNRKAADEPKEADEAVNGTHPVVANKPEYDALPSVTDGVKEHEVVENAPATISLDKDKDKEKEKDMTRKKEKKKRSEEERKARKEKKRKLAEANGSIPMEIYYDSSDSSSVDVPTGTSTGTDTPKTTNQPTTNPVRIYRRCCQLRETPILKRITEQLTDSANSHASGTVDKLDLTGYWLQLPDLITIGDYLAVVPVREVILENSGLSDEGLRVILAGLLAAKRPDGKRRKPKHEFDTQGGVVERLVLKNNKLGPDGWKHLSLFLYLCRSLKYLDLSHVPFPRQSSANKSGALPNGMPIPRSISDIFSKALAERPGGATLELVNIGETEPSMEQLSTIIDGIIQCGVRRLGLAHNQIDERGIEHVARYLAAGKCEGLDLGGNDLRNHIEKLAASVKETDPLWALSLAGCNLSPSSLCKIIPCLVKLSNFRFVDLSHNHDLFQSTPSAVGMLRRNLPKLENLKRIHLQDVNMSSEQAIALVEVIPEVHSLAHINLLGNSELRALAGARTEEAQEEACALYASLMAAARVSKSLICVDIEVPGDEAGEIVKAMAKQVVAYCLRNMEHLPEHDIGTAVASAPTENQTDGHDSKPPGYSDVLAHLVGHDVLDQDDSTDNETAPDEDYVIGGTGVVKALTCCLKNRGDESTSLSGEFIQEMEDEDEEVSLRPRLPTGGKAKDMSKHLLAGARKIRSRLQPALNKAKANPGDEQNLRKLMFLDDTLNGIIKRFEDEFPDTREMVPDLTTAAHATKEHTEEPLATTPPAVDDFSAIASDGEYEAELQVSRPLSRSNSTLSRVLAEEEGRVLRAGHKFRSGFLRQEHFDVINTIDEIGSDETNIRLLSGLADDVGGELLDLVREKGAIRAFKEHKDLVIRSMRESDPEHWDRFIESQRKARANINLDSAEKNGEVQHADESAIAD